MNVVKLLKGQKKTVCLVLQACFARESSCTTIWFKVRYSHLSKAANSRIDRFKSFFVYISIHFSSGRVSVIKRG